MRSIYIKNNKKNVRYALGEINKKGGRTLLCLGVNPSTAIPGNLDNTLKNVVKISKFNGYDSWIMLNVYPLRETNPKNLPKVIDKSLHKKNLKTIRRIFRKYRNNSDLLLAYGDLILYKIYLLDCRNDIRCLVKKIKYQGKMLCIDKTKKGNPGHPLYKKQQSTLITFTF